MAEDIQYRLVSFSALMCSMQLIQIWVKLSHIIGITEDMQYGVRKIIGRWKWEAPLKDIPKKIYIILSVTSIKNSQKSLLGCKN